jgi:hypothetical protein
MSAMVSCSQCRSVVPQTETVFSNQGDLLCSRCGAFDSAHAQVERARAAAHEEAGRHRGAIGLVVGAFERAAADRQAGQMHSDLVAVAHTGPAQHASTVPCSRCNAIVPRSDTTLSLEGDAMCRQCASTYDAAAERRRIEGSLFIGFLWGFLLSIVGVGLTHVLGRRPAEKKGAWVGATIQFGLIYFALPLMLK